MGIFARRRTMRSAKRIQQIRRRLLVRGGILLAIIIIVLGGLSFLSHHKTFLIERIVVNGNNVVQNASIEHLARETFSGSYFYLFSRSNSLIFPSGELTARILENISQIESVDIVRTDLHTISIDVVEQRPFALWCREFIIAKDSEEESEEECFFLNSEGFIFAEAPNFTGNVFFRFYGEVKGDEPIRKRYTTTTEFLRMNVLIDSLEGLAVTPIELRPENEQDFALYLEEGGKIIYNREQRPSEIVDNLKAVLDSELFKEVGLVGTDYIDLRFGNKVYFKAKSESR